jgi:hypothetical protein
MESPIGRAPAPAEYSSLADLILLWKRNGSANSTTGLRSTVHNHHCTPRQPAPTALNRVKQQNGFGFGTKSSNSFT